MLMCSLAVCGPERGPGGTYCNPGEEIPECTARVNVSPRPQRQAGVRASNQRLTNQIGRFSNFSHIADHLPSHLKRA